MHREPVVCLVPFTGMHIIIIIIIIIIVSG